MGERIEAVKRGATSWLGLLAVVMLILALLIAVIGLGAALRSTNNQVDVLLGAQTCRARSAVLLADAETRRADVLAELDQALALLFDASIKRDTNATAIEAAKLASLAEQIRVASEVVDTARVDRLGSVDRCAKEGTT